MTDDKGAGEAYKQEYGDMEPDHPCVPDVWKNGYNAGRKAERERCAKIVENEPPPHDECVNLKWGLCCLIAKKIRGGQDAEHSEFAGMALQGILSNPTTVTSEFFKNTDGFMNSEMISERAYEQADSIIRAGKGEEK